jgi:hypothetical protein
MQDNFFGCSKFDSNASRRQVGFGLALSWALQKHTQSTGLAVESTVNIWFWAALREAGFHYAGLDFITRSAQWSGLRQGDPALSLSLPLCN